MGGKPQISISAVQAAEKLYFAIGFEGAWL